ncbi:hypothetical protein SAMN03080601_02217 [Alkalitalea saponilacus]|uniref:Uncharacterized protein n=1 Tax=Alkalitalea saponilacus TaxID=889453 RepID=A0A1T5HBP0_9BACT|nr:hypothetical protein SAMN03080601_02217 [Alkalitalea saponilacus]
MMFFYVDLFDSYSLSINPDLVSLIKKLPCILGRVVLIEIYYKPETLLCTKNKNLTIDPVHSFSQHG